MQDVFIYTLQVVANICLIASKLCPILFFLILSDIVHTSFIDNVAKAGSLHLGEHHFETITETVQCVHWQSQSHPVAQECSSESRLPADIAGPTELSRSELDLEQNDEVWCSVPC
jgi:hypothetical protein